MLMIRVLSSRNYLLSLLKFIKEISCQHTHQKNEKRIKPLKLSLKERLRKRSNYTDFKKEDPLKYILSISVILLVGCTTKTVPWKDQCTKSGGGITTCSGPSSQSKELQVAWPCCILKVAQPAVNNTKGD